MTKAKLGWAALGVMGVFLFLMAFMMLRDGIPEYGRLSRLATEGVKIPATVIRVDSEMQSGANPTGSNTEGGIVHLASVRYEIDGVSHSPKQRLGIDDREAARYRETRALGFEVLVLRDSPTFAYRPQAIPGNSLVALLAPLVILVAGAACVAVARFGLKARPG